MRLGTWMGLGVGIAVATAAVAPAQAAAPALDFSLGFGTATLDDTLPEIDNSLNTRFNLTWSFSLFEEDQRLRLGFGFSVEGAEERGSRTSDDGDRIQERPYAQLFAFTPEVRIAWHQPFAERWFIEPNVAFGLPIAHYSVGEIETYRRRSDYYDQDDGDTTVGIGVRPGVMIGYWLAPRHAIGLDATYFIGSLDFDNVGPDYQAWSIGVFYRLGF